MKLKTQEKLKRFLDEKLKNIFYDTRDAHHGFNMYYIRSVKGFDMTDIQNNIWGNGYSFFNSIGCHCNLHLDGKKNRICIEIDNISSSYWRGTIGMLYRCLDEINEIAGEFRKLKGDLEKQDKINDIAKNSIITWLKTLMQNLPYSYYTSENENKIILSIKMKNRVQLDIPVYYNRFQKIITELPETIQEFEKTAKKSKIKVLISNSRSGQLWTIGCK